MVVANAGSAKEPERLEARGTGSAAKDLENEEGIGRRTTGLWAQPTWELRLVGHAFPDTSLSLV